MYCCLCSMNLFLVLWHKGHKKVIYWHFKSKTQSVANLDICEGGPDSNESLDFLIVISRPDGASLRWCLSLCCSWRRRCFWCFLCVWLLKVSFIPQGLSYTLCSCHLWDLPGHPVLFVCVKMCVSTLHIYLQRRVCVCTPSRRMPISSNPPWYTLRLQADILLVVFNFSFVIQHPPCLFHSQLCVCDPARPLLAAPYST